MIKALSCFGLGKLGLPLAALFARSGLSTLGIDKDRALVPAKTVAALFARINGPATQFRLMALKEAEITKLAHNVFGG